MKIIILLLLSLQSYASIRTNIISIEESKNQESLDVLVSWNGRVFEVSKEQKSIISLLEEAQRTGLQVNLDVEKGEHFNLLNAKEMITQVELLSHLSQKNNLEGTEVGENPMSNFEPTDVGTMENANKIFKGLNSKTRRFSQCFNRAHIWSKSMWDKYKIKSMKIFIFYTKKFRTEVSDKWWYHVAPMIKVGDKKMVMDREFTRTPKSAKEWEKIFTGKMNIPGYRCLKMNNISTYFDSNNYNNEYCNIQYASMYHWGPNDLKTTANDGLIQTHWKNWKLREASKQAFKRWRKVYQARKTK